MCIMRQYIVTILYTVGGQAAGGEGRGGGACLVVVCNQSHDHPVQVKEEHQQVNA